MILWFPYFDPLIYGFLCYNSIRIQWKILVDKNLNQGMENPKIKQTEHLDIKQLM